MTKPVRVSSYIIFCDIVTYIYNFKILCISAPTPRQSSRKRKHINCNKHRNEASSSSESNANISNKVPKNTNNKYLNLTLEIVELPGTSVARCSQHPEHDSDDDSNEVEFTPASTIDIVLEDDRKSATKININNRKSLSSSSSE